MALVVGAKGVGAERVGADGTGADGFGLPLDLDGLCLHFDFIVGHSLDGVGAEGVGAEGVGADGIGSGCQRCGGRESQCRWHWC